MLPPFKAIIFDLDGTLTKPQHDFDAIRRTLGIPPDRLILEFLASLPPAEARRRHAQLEAIELELAKESEPAVGCLELLARLQTEQIAVAILTRNSRNNALTSLGAMRATHYVEDQLVIGRDEATAKPDPAGILLLAERMGVGATDCLMVGDYRHDLEAGRRAGCFTLHLAHPTGATWPQYTDLAIASLTELNQLIP